MLVDARTAALDTLLSYRRNLSRPEITLDAIAKKERMDRRDTALAHNLVMGVLQNQTLCDYYIGRYSNTPVKRMESSVLEILRMSVYQLVFLDRVPSRAAVSEGVALAKKRSKHGAGLVNAVLRRIAENRDSLPAIECGTREEYFSIKYSHPIWLVKRLTERFGYDACEAILMANNKEPSVTIQTNVLKIAPEELGRRLENDGIDAKTHPVARDAFMIHGSGALTEMAAFREGLFYVQDVSSKMAVLAAPLKPGMDVIDLCAAPGGKSFAAGILMENRGRIRAFDIHEKKLPLITRGAKRLGISIIETGTMDAKKPEPELIGKGDVVFADVPCSGIGVIRKKPEIRYKSEKDIAALPDTQLEILKGAAELVRPGGALMYSTCTILQEENEEVVSRFLEQDARFAYDPMTLPEPYSGENGSVLILPTEDMDGFFVCRLRRI